MFTPAKTHRLHRRLLIGGGVLFLLGAALTIYAYSWQSSWKSITTSDIETVGQQCVVRGDINGQLYRGAYTVESQTYYYDECRKSAVQEGEIWTIMYDPRDPYDAMLNTTAPYKYAGIAIAASGLVVTIAALFVGGFMRHKH